MAKRWCQPDKFGPRRFIVWFEDRDVGMVVFDNEEEARAYFEKADTNWNCTLFSAMPLLPGTGESEAE